MLNPTNIPELEPFLRFLDSIEYEPSTQFIKETNVMKKSYAKTTTSFEAKFSYKNGQYVKEKPAVVQDKQVSELDLIYNDSLIEEMKTLMKVTIKKFEQLENMSLKDLKVHALHLERYYYNDNTIKLNSFDTYTKEETLELILETQDNIIEEYTGYGHMMEEEESHSDLTTQDKMTMLRDCGVPAKEIMSATEETIDKWYEELNAPF